MYIYYQLINSLLHFCFTFTSFSFFHILACVLVVSVCILTVCVCFGVQIGTTKGTGGDILILEEAAYCDEGFFYETVAPILSIGNASLVAISTLTSEINFYTRLIKMTDPATDRPLFVTRCIELACEKCKEEGKAHECVHMLHLVPSWQSAERHRKLKIMMQDRPDLIQSELAGLAFDSLQQVFRKCDVSIMFDSPCMPFTQDQMIWITIDPAAGGPSSDYAVVSMCRTKGCVTVSVFNFVFIPQVTTFIML